MAALSNDNTVFGYFSSETQAEAAVRELREAGFTRNEISIAGRPDSDSYSDSSTSSAGSTASNAAHKAGHAAEGFWDRVKGFFEGDDVEPYADERTRGEMATREVTTEDDVYDYDPQDLHQSWGSDRAGYFNQQYSRTGQGIIVSVSAGDRREEAESILQSNGADLGSNATADTSAYAGASNDAYADTSTDAYAGETNDVEGTRRIRLYGEVLRVHRDRVQRGEARLRKETVTETQNVQVPVTREELVVERVPVTGEQRAASGVTIGSENEEIRIPLNEERVTVDKEPVLREEVKVGKRQITDNETREETVRREELRVDNDQDENYRKAS